MSNLVTIKSCSDAAVLYFFFNDTATTEIYTLSLHDALPISLAHTRAVQRAANGVIAHAREILHATAADEHYRVLLKIVALTADRKSTRLNSSHSQISYAVFCLKKKYTSPSSQLRPSIFYSHC